MRTKTRSLPAISVVFACVALLPNAQAATPAPYGRHPSGNTGATPTPTPCSSLWVEATAVPYAAEDIFAASDGIFVYTGGGVDSSGFFRNDLLRYDPVADSWEPLASSPDHYAASPAVYFDGKIYNMGGFVSIHEPTGTTRIYDTSTNTWATAAPMPKSLGGQATGLWNGVIYVAGGADGILELDTLYAYDIASDTWTTLASLPQRLAFPGFGVVNGKLYIAGGVYGTAVLNTLYIYDIATNTWTTGANLPHAVEGPGSTVFNGLLYLYGGGLPFTNITQIYDPISDIWSSGPNMNVNRYHFYGTAVGNDRIVAPGGFDQNPVNDNEQLISSPCATPTATPTATQTPTPTARSSPTPRLRPTPYLRPTPG